jgi:hypothetical protein
VLKAWTRPDGRCFVFGEADNDLPLGRVYATAEETNEAWCHRRSPLATGATAEPAKDGCSTTAVRDDGPCAELASVRDG